MNPTELARQRAVLDDQIAFVDRLKRLYPTFEYEFNGSGPSWQLHATCGAVRIELDIEEVKCHWGETSAQVDVMEPHLLRVVQRFDASRVLVNGSPFRCRHAREGSHGHPANVLREFGYPELNINAMYDNPESSFEFALLCAVTFLREQLAALARPESSSQKPSRSR